MKEYRKTMRPASGQAWPMDMLMNESMLESNFNKKREKKTSEPDREILQIHTWTYLKTHDLFVSLCRRPATLYNTDEPLSFSALWSAKHFREALNLFWVCCDRVMTSHDLVITGMIYARLHLPSGFACFGGSFNLWKQTGGLNPRLLMFSLQSN